MHIRELFEDASLIRSLEQFPAIAWDFDETLVDSPVSPLLHRFIKENPQIHHVIVTFRSHGMENRVWSDLRHYPDSPSRFAFDGVFNIGDKAWEAMSLAALDRENGRLEGPPTPAELFYIEWKGWVCSQNSLPVLIDDKVDLVIQGCQKYGIKLINPLDFQ